MSTATETKFWTPPEIAKRLRVTPDRVIGWLLAGEMRGVDVSSKSATRPRYKISEEAFQEFLLRRSAAVAPAPKRPRRAASKREFYA